MSIEKKFLKSIFFYIPLGIKKEKYQVLKAKYPYIFEIVKKLFELVI